MNDYNSNPKTKNRKEQFREVIIYNLNEIKRNHGRKIQRNKRKREKNR